MVTLLVALIAAVQPIPAHQVNFNRTAWIFSTIGHSEFCPPGDVMIDLRTGRYKLTVRAPRRVCDQVGIERAVRSGTLDSEKLTRLRAAFQRVATEGGLERPRRREITGTQYIVITNGGTPTLVLKTGRGTISAPDEIDRWTKAATALHDALDAAFGTRDWK